MSSPPQRQNPFAATTELSDGSPEDLEKNVNRLVGHANRAGLSIIGLLFLGFLGPAVYTLVFFFQVRECGRLIEACRRGESDSVRRLEDAKSRFRGAAQFYGVLLIIEVVCLVILLLPQYF